MLSVAPKLRPSLDPEFLPAPLWRRAYAELVARDAGARPFALALVRPDGAVFRHEGRVLSAGHPAAELTLTYVERLLKFLLWMKGGAQVLVAGADEIAVALAAIYHPAGARAFDHDFMGAKIFDRAFTVEASTWAALPAAQGGSSTSPTGRPFCRVPSARPRWLRKKSCLHGGAETAGAGAGGQASG